MPKIFAPVGDQALQEQFKRANQEAIRQLKDLDRWFEDQGKTATEAFALGPERFKRMLWDTERVKISLEDLEKIGRSDLRRNREAR